MKKFILFLLLAFSVNALAQSSGVQVSTSTTFPSASVTNRYADAIPQVSWVSSGGAGTTTNGYGFVVLGPPLAGSAMTITNPFAFYVVYGGAVIGGTEALDAYIHLDCDDGDDNADTWIIKSEASANDLTFTNHTTKLLNLTSDGRLYGTALHNNAGAVTGTTNQYIASGTYTPTLTNIANVSNSTAYACQWTRVGNVVDVSGEVDIDATTTATLTQLGISLPPIASLLTASNQLGGTACNELGDAGRVAGDATNDRAEIRVTPVSVTNDRYSFTFKYVIL